MDDTEEMLSDVLAQLKNLKAWAVAKAEGVEQRIAAVGGAPRASVQALIDEIRAEGGVAAEPEAE